MEMHRDEQRRILERLADVYPLLESAENLTAPEHRWMLAYLIEHGLVKGEMSYGMGSKLEVSYGPLKITAKGLDFLSDDGGLSAVLGVVTIKFHDDALRQVLIERANQSDEIESSQKSRIVQMIRELPAEGMKHLSLELMGRGVSYLPAALEIARRAMG